MSTTTSSTFDHIGLKVPAAVFDAETAFMAAALAPLGITEHFRIHPLVAALGTDAKKPDFWISALADGQPLEGPASPLTRMHLAFKATSRAQVDEFHKLGVVAGGKDDGAPGIREKYHKGYYAAFIVSPGGHGIEAVFHDWELAARK